MKFQLETSLFMVNAPVMTKKRLSRGKISVAGLVAKYGGRMVRVRKGKKTKMNRWRTSFRTKERPVFFFAEMRGAY